MVGTAPGWMDELEILYSRMARRFARSEPRRRALSYLRGLTGGLERKNGWQLAEAATRVARRVGPVPIAGRLPAAGARPQG